MKSQANVSIIVLAAGSSRRMGETNKLLLPWKKSSI
ncbi:MAG: NTP transferase domain-containing protein, partial [SAR324 cluster bacterium]|nr:NTP transferase domain-containing protein [SAR324 cluster bacterium]